MRHALVVAACLVAGCHSHSVDSGGDDCGGSHVPDLGLGGGNDSGDMAYASLPDGGDLGGAPAGDMAPSPESFIRCRGQGGAIAWEQPIGAVTLWYTGDIYELTPRASTTGVFVGRSDVDSSPNGMQPIGRLTSFYSGGTIADAPDGYYDWSIGGGNWTNVFSVAGDNSGGMTMYVVALGPQTLALGGALGEVAVPSGTHDYFATYDSVGRLQWVTELTAPMLAMARGSDGRLYVAGIIPGDTTPYTVDYGTGPINVGANNLVAVTEVDASGKLVKITTVDTGAPFAPGVTQPFVRRIAVDGSNNVWVSYFVVDQFGNTFDGDAAIALLPASGAAPSIRHLGNYGAGALVAAGPDGRIAVAFRDANSAMNVEMWTASAQLAWRNVYGVAANYYPSALAVDGHDNVVVIASVQPLKDGTVFAPDVGGGPLLEGWSGPELSGYELIAKYDANGYHVWSKLSSFIDDGYRTEPPMGHHLAADADGHVYLATRQSPVTICGSTTPNPPQQLPNTRYLLELAP